MSDHKPLPAGRDANDEKVMVNSQPEAGSEKGRTIQASNTTLNNSQNSPIEAYYSFPSSKCTPVENPYFGRMQDLSDALGWKDTVKG